MKRLLASAALAFALWLGAGASVAWAAPAHLKAHTIHPNGPMVSDFVF
ncbi:MAG: hypothetical protein IMW98_02300 [Firmicutes bacterium]|nr:hypothetical protein [Bacillota bacterium]